jgi:uncharacterized protein
LILFVFACALGYWAQGVRQETALETTFTPLQSLFGGGLIGLSAVLLMLLLGRIMGATGILAGVFVPASRADWLWRTAVVLGMMTGPWVVWAATGALPVVHSDLPRVALILGGLIVGVGVTLGGGCTSGHGVCGLARLSPRSAIAVAVFMATAILTVFVIRHVIGA